MELTLLVERPTLSVQDAVGTVTRSFRVREQLSNKNKVSKLGKGTSTNKVINFVLSTLWWVETKILESASEYWFTCHI